MFAEVMTANRDKELTVLVSTEEEAKWRIENADGKVMHAGTMVPGEGTVIMVPGEVLKMDSVESSETLVYIPSWNKDAVLTEAEFRKVEAVRKAALDKVPGIHIGI